MDHLANEFVFPSDIWGVIMQNTNLYDTIFIRATSKWLNKLCKEFRPFPKYHVLDQLKCTNYLIKNGSISCLDYVKNVLHFEWTTYETRAAVRCGQVSVLKHLLANGCTFEEQIALIYCTQNECSLDMLKYLHERGITWQSQFRESDSQKHYKYFIADMAMRGHLDCIKFALETGCTDQKVFWTPSMECLEFIIQNQFDWKDVPKGLQLDWRSEKSICEYAAECGNISLLQYAHQNGAPLNSSALYAARAGQLECLKYAMEHCEDQKFVPESIMTIECFKYLLAKCRREVKAKYSWMAIGSDIDYLKYIISLGIPLPIDDARHFPTLLLAAASSSTTDVMKFLFDHVPAEKMQQACLEIVLTYVRRGDRAGLELLFERNMPVSTLDFQKIAGAAFRSGDTDIDMVKFVWKKFPNKEGYNVQGTLSEAGYSTPEKIDFFVEKGAKLTEEHLLQAAHSVGNLPVTAYLTQRGIHYPKLPHRESVCVKYLKDHQRT